MCIGKFVFFSCGRRGEGGDYFACTNSICIVCAAYICGVWSIFAGFELCNIDYLDQEAPALVSSG